MNNYYDKKYFAWQKKAGEYGANQDIWMYAPYVKKTDTILDYGCGGGFLLERIIARKKYGVDINALALDEARKKGIQAYQSLDKIPKNVKFDIIMSHHTLEHVENPAETLKQLYSRLREKGKIVCVVPIDDWRKQKKYTKDDINMHLYTWTPLLLGNLFNQCGYSIRTITIIMSAWLPLSRYYYRYIPKPIYSFFSNIWSRIILYRQLRIVAVRKK